VTVASPDVRVGVVSWNTAAFLDRCLAALPAALGRLTAEVVVVDNDSHDGSAEVAAQHPGVRVEQAGENLGYARAMNRALAGTAAPVLIALNPDTEAPPGSLARLVEVLGQCPEAAVVAPRLAHPDGTTQHSAYRFPSLSLAAALSLLPLRLQRGALGRRLLLESAPLPQARAGVDWAIGAVHVIRAAALVGAAPYRERWFVYVEDLDLCWRLRRTGWTVIYEPAIEVAHVGNAAGVQAWGAGKTRTERWLHATYDWYALERGRREARAWAALNLLGVLGHGLAGVASGWWGGEKGAARRAQGRRLLQLAPIHARMCAGPRQDD
jgi:hypothetical protein